MAMPTLLFMLTAYSLVHGNAYPLIHPNRLLSCSWQCLPSCSCQPPILLFMPTANSHVHAKRLLSCSWQCLLSSFLLIAYSLVFASPLHPILFANLFCCHFIVVTCSDKFCYYLLKEPRNWLTSHEECHRFHANLVSITNANENEWITNKILRQQNIDEVHLGRWSYLKEKM